MIYKAKRSRKDAGKPRTFHGKQIIDAAKPRRITVTEEDRNGGVILDLEECAMAQAIKRTMHPVDVRVGRSVILVEHRDYVERFHTPAPIRDQLIRFDASHEHKEFTPGTYTMLPVPKSIIKNRGKQHSKPDRARGDPNKSRIKRTLNGEKGRPELAYSS